MARIKIGSRVSTEAWRFDSKCSQDSDRWSFSLFGPDWRDSRVTGIVVDKCGGKWMVKWDVDGEKSAFETEVLHKEPDANVAGKISQLNILFFILWEEFFFFEIVKDIQLNKNKFK